MVQLRAVSDSDPAWLAQAFPRYMAEIAPQIDLGPEAEWWPEVVGQTWVIHGPEIMGFVMIRRTAEPAWDLAEFFVEPAFRGRGIGRQAAECAFADRPGQWQLGVVKQGPARQFWARILPQTPGLIDLRTTKPLFPSQVLGYRFTITGEARWET